MIQKYNAKLTSGGKNAKTTASKMNSANRVRSDASRNAVANYRFFNLITKFFRDESKFKKHLLT